MKIEYTEEKNKAIMETLLVSGFDVEQMMAVGYALAKQVKKEPVDSTQKDEVVQEGQCFICGNGVNISQNYCCECGKALKWFR